ncbi:MAG: hypothetical protein D6790_09130 [Caldilineae bacterium]|nr:MAG: hypothetical protein D6790_09130 [Caldilineae bacterium]
MDTTIEKRLETLRAEYEAGQQMLADLEAQKRELQTTMLRISGAIQVLEELLREMDADAADEEPAAGGETAGEE